MSGLLNYSSAERIDKFIDVYQWLRKASGERLLSRRNFNFTAVHPFANAITIVDISAPDFWAVRLSGTKACERRGADITGNDAQKNFVAEERALRIRLAYSLFHNPCGIRATAEETYANGQCAVLDTVALPMIGSKGEQLVVHYAQVIEDIEHAYRRRPAAVTSTLLSHEYVDLGYGVPSDRDCAQRQIA